MNVNHFTKKFHEIEINSRAFEFQDINGLNYWDAVRYKVYQYSYKCLLDRRTNFDTKIVREKKVKLWAKSFISRFIQLLVISVLKQSKKKLLILKCSRHFSDNTWQDKIVSQISPLLLNNNFTIETSVSKKSLFHSMNMFESSEFILPEALKKDLNEFENIFFNAFDLVIDIQAVVENALSKFYVELDFYRRLFTQTKVEKVFMVQNGIQKGIFKAAQESNVEVNEFQHGFIGYAHPAYSYPKLKLNDANIFLPHRLLTYADFWNEGYHFPVKNILTIGSSNHSYSNKYEKINTEVLIISADVYHEELASLVKVLSYKLKQYNFKYKLHSNQYHQKQAIEIEFSNNKNVDVVAGELNIADCLASSRHVLCIHSTVVYEALHSGSYVYCFKRQNYSTHQHLVGVNGFIFFDNADELIEVLTAKRDKKLFTKTKFFVPFQREVMNSILN